MGPAGAAEMNLVQDAVLEHTTQVVCRRLLLTPPRLMKICSESRKPARRVGAFALLVHLMADGATDLDFHSDDEDLFRFGVSLYVTSQREPDFRLGQDEALYWYWWAIDEYLLRAEEEGLTDMALYNVKHVCQEVSRPCLAPLLTLTSPAVGDPARRRLSRPPHPFRRVPPVRPCAPLLGGWRHSPG